MKTDSIFFPPLSLDYIIDVEAGQDYFAPVIDLSHINKSMIPMGDDIIRADELDGVKLGDKWRHEPSPESHEVLCFTRCSDRPAIYVISTRYLWTTLESVKECKIT